MQNEVKTLHPIQATELDSNQFDNQTAMLSVDNAVETEGDDSVNFVVAGHADAKDPFVSVLAAAIAALEERFTWPPRFIECTQHCRFAVASTSIPSTLFFFDLRIRLLSAAQILGSIVSSSSQSQTAGRKPKEKYAARIRSSSASL